MAKTKVTFEMNSKVYEQMNEICENLGMSPEDAFEIFAHKVVNDNEIPFIISEKDFPVDEKTERIRKIFTVASWLAVGAACFSVCTAVLHLFKDSRK